MAKKKGVLVGEATAQAIGAAERRIYCVDFTGEAQRTVYVLANSASDAERQALARGDHYNAVRKRGLRIYSVTRRLIGIHVVDADKWLERMDPSTSTQDVPFAHLLPQIARKGRRRSAR